MSSSKNLEYQKNSFLNKANSAFIESMYLRYIKKDPNLPQSWQKYFKSLNEDVKSIVKEIEGPSWARNINKKLPSDKSEEKFLSNNEDINNPQIQTIKAIALIRAYRIRGHLIANLDPLNMMDRKYIHELHPEDHGFSRTLGLRISDFAYSTDLVELPANSLQYLTGLHTWVIGVFSKRPHPTHVHLDKALDWIDKAAPKRAILTHLGPELDFEDLKRNLPEHVLPAFDGQKFSCPD